ncbi:serine/threonine-protein kinase [Streptomyces palmae]|uniref:Serine/threonine protein kinase n=1 Tax=Streptomyces palmae TaxID=1701085 RepID=A0A4Z0H8X1_9ACTN|nr:serine/threonine-protein kinase [Streptomyces palmae]TGB08657.1 serine/threonine protein kinase [Streptomyces palmae]
MQNAAEVFQPLQADDPRRVAGYRVAARLGAGGMGRVYLSHTQGGRPVAIKVVRPELADDPAFRRRFSREIKAAQRVRGAYTAELIDADADGTPPWLATLYVPGPSLTEAVARGGPLPVPAVLWLMAGVAEALQVIHGAGIVHRDLKPSNVLLAADGPRVIDFGISLASGISSHTASGTTIGTPHYMAPEQASAGEVTAATDVFALGQTAAFAALGHPLYGDGPAVSVLYRIVHSAPDLSPLPEQLRPLIGRCLSADPEERATPAQIVEWCREQLGSDVEAGGGPEVWQEVTGPEVPAPPPVVEPAPLHTLAFSTRLQPAAPDERRTRRRRAALITTAAVLALALVLGLAWLLMDQSPGDRDAATSGKTGSAASSGATPASGASAPTAGADGRRPATSESTPTAPATPKPTPYAFQWLDEKNSVSVREPVQHKDRTGDIRLACSKTSCALESDTSKIAMRWGKPGAGLDECRIALSGDNTGRSLPLAAAAAGTEICVEHPSGDIALLVIQVKATALPGSGNNFLTADMTVWRHR